MRTQKIMVDYPINAQAFEVKPMRFYELTDKPIDEIQIGDLVVARIEFYSENVITMSLANGIKAEMAIEDFADMPEATLIKTVLSKIGRKALGRVIYKDDERLILERRSVERDTNEWLRTKSMGLVVDATIETMYEHGVFVDIGNGIISMIYVTEISRARYFNLNQVFSIGEELKVRIMEYKPDTKHFIISRKAAYENTMNFEPGAAFIVTINHFVNDNKDGIFVEYDPAHIGIMDFNPYVLPSDFKFGDRVVVVLKKYRSKGFCCSFVAKVE